jgi:hypothetical protein
MVRWKRKMSGRTSKRLAVGLLATVFLVGFAAKESEDGSIIKELTLDTSIPLGECWSRDRVKVQAHLSRLDRASLSGDEGKWLVQALRQAPDIATAHSLRRCYSQLEEIAASLSAKPENPDKTLKIGRLKQKKIVGPKPTSNYGKPAHDQEHGRGVSQGATRWNRWQAPLKFKAAAAKQAQGLRDEATARNAQDYDIDGGDHEGGDGDGEDNDDDTGDDDSESQDDDSDDDYNGNEIENGGGGDDDFQPEDKYLARLKIINKGSLSNTLVLEAARQGPGSSKIQATDEDDGNTGGGGRGNSDGRDGADADEARGIIPWKLAGKGRDRSRDEMQNWWLANSGTPVGLSCVGSPSPTDEAVLSRRHDDNYFYKSHGIAPPLFRARMPHSGTEQRIQIAFIVPFVEFQINKLANLLTEHWVAYPPCLPHSLRQSADLIFFTEHRLSDYLQRRIRTYYSELGIQKTGCFHTDEPKFLSLSGVDSTRSHLEGAAYSFFSLFRLLERNYVTFALAEPDIAPVQAGFIPALVRKSFTVSCKAEGLWQLGSPPLSKDVDVSKLRERLDFHMNGNALYALGCPDFEDYMCRAQTFYAPKDLRGICRNVAGCATNSNDYEGGYDHVLYRFRMHADNYEYSRLILHKFAYSDFVQNHGEGLYDPVAVVKHSPSTYFVHSKSIYISKAATILNEVAMSVIGRLPCESASKVSPDQLALENIYRYLRSGEYSDADAVRHLCVSTHSSSRICNMYADGSRDPPGWKFRMPGKTYVWSMDLHGGPANCDMAVIGSAGGVLHAETTMHCQYYGLCTDRLKVLRANNAKDVDPTETQIQEFTATYKSDPEFERVDAFICHHPAANCELFLPFKKSIIVRASTRLEFGRHDEGIDWRNSSGYDRSVGAKKWKQWVRTLQNLAKDSHNIIAANNLYDRDYIKYFTGIQDVLLLPSWCGDNCVGASLCKPGWESSVTEEWLPTRPEVMIVPYRSNLDRSRYINGIRDPKDHPIIKELAAVPEFISNGTAVKMIRELYSDANPLRMLKHPAIVVLPYQISTIQMVELYRLNIPTFCPSLSLLKRWCREHDLLWEVHYGWPENLMNVTDIPNPNGRPQMDKYGKEWEDMFDHWIPKSDFYRFGHITYFDSWEHFHRLYRTMKEKGELDTTSHKMAESNAKLRKSLVEKWRHVLQRVRRDRVRD